MCSVLQTLLWQFLDYGGAMKLPKQWSHWLRKNKMKDTSPKSFAKNSTWLGNGRYWRINCYGEFQVSCKLPDWDKWSNSLCYSVPHIPTTEKEFSDTVEFMLKRCKRKERLMEYMRLLAFRNSLLKCEYAEQIDK